MGDAIRKLQRLLRVDDDGAFGPQTGSALWAAWRAGAIQAQDPIVLAARTEACLVYGRDPAAPGAPGSVVLINGRWRPLPLDVPLWVVPYRLGQLQSKPRAQRPVQVILHHDVCGDALDCFDELRKARKSTHLNDDDNGIVLQFLDLFSTVAWHAMGHVRIEDGSRVEHSFNWRSIGMDLSNPVLPDSADGKADAGRGLQTAQIHGRTMTELAFYPCQIESALQMLKFIRSEVPSINGSFRVDSTWKGDLTGSTPGVFGHYHVNAGKIDPFGFPMARLAEVVG